MKCFPSDRKSALAGRCERAAVVQTNSVSDWRLCLETLLTFVFIHCLLFVLTSAAATSWSGLGKDGELV